MSLRGYIVRLRDAFGFKFIALICITQCFLKGFNFVIMTKGLLPYFKDMGIGAIQLQVYGAIGLSPWTIKPLIGVVSDLIAINGYHKRYTMLLSCIVGIAGIAVLVPTIQIALLTVFLVVCSHYQIAVCDLLVEGKYAEIMRENPETASDIVTLASGLQQFGFLICIGILGPLADLGYFRIIFGIALGVSVTPIIPVWLGWLPEKQIPNAPYIQLDTKRIKQDWRIIIVVAITGLAAPAVAALSGFAAKWIGMLCALVVLVVCVGGGFWAMPHPLIARVALYQVLAQTSKISFANILDYFYIADEACLPGGPHFEYWFYITITGIAGAAAAVCTTILYQIFFSRWRFRSVLFCTAALASLSGLFDFIIVMRWNIAVGIPDGVIFLIGDDVIGAIVFMLYWIPSSSIIGKVCPKDMESSTYAYLAGISNFGTMISTITGAMLADWFEISTTGVCNWDNLPWLILFGHVCVMLVISVPAAFLIPNVAQDTDILGMEKEDEEQEKVLIQGVLMLPSGKELLDEEDEQIIEGVF